MHSWDNQTQLYSLLSWLLLFTVSLPDQPLLLLLSHRTLTASLYRGISDFVSNGGEEVEIDKKGGYTVKRGSRE